MHLGFVFFSSCILKNVLFLLLFFSAVLIFCRTLLFIISFFVYKLVFLYHFLFVHFFIFLFYYCFKIYFIRVFLLGDTSNYDYSCLLYNHLFYCRLRRCCLYIFCFSFWFGSAHNAYVWFAVFGFGMIQLCFFFFLIFRIVSLRKKKITECLSISCCDACPSECVYIDIMNEINDAFNLTMTTNIPLLSLDWNCFGVACGW